MLSFKHNHVMSLIGVCIDGQLPLLIMPFMSNGSVLDYVRKNKDKLLITSQFLEEEVCVLFTPIVARDVCIIYTDSS